MGVIELNQRIENHPSYIFIQRHKQVIMVLEGIFIIILLIYMDAYVIKDHIIKKEIAKNCDWGEEDFFCICERSDAVAIRNELEGRGEIKIDIDELSSVFEFG